MPLALPLKLFLKLPLKLSVLQKRRDFKKQVFIWGGSLSGFRTPRMAISDYPVIVANLGFSCTRIVVSLITRKR